MEKRWDFYLTDENEETYLYFNLTSYSFGPELSEVVPNRSEYVARFHYSVEPKAVLGKPDGTKFTFDEFIGLFFEQEDMRKFGNGTIKLKCSNGKDLYIEGEDSVGDVIGEMNGSTAELVMKYGAALSIMNPMAHLVYWKQLEEKTPENIFLEDPEDRNGVYWLRYHKEQEYLAFDMRGLSHLESLDGAELTRIAMARPYEYYEFERFDFVRGVSRWFDLSSFIFDLAEIHIHILYQSGKEETITIDKEKDLKMLLRRWSKADAGIKDISIQDIKESQVKDMIKENYFNTHRLFVDIVENFDKIYKKIPAIADNSQIIEEA